MKKINNISLMLKQGIKGVFKFKIQFIIIVILAFISTLILSASLSTERRLQDSYDKIVKPINKFEYSGSMKVGTSAGSQSDPFIISSLLDGSDAATYSVTDKDGKVLRSENAINFVLDNFDGSGDAASYSEENTNSFIVKATKHFLNVESPTSTFVSDYAWSAANNGWVRTYGGSWDYSWFLQSYLFEDLETVSEFGNHDDFKGFSTWNNDIKYSSIGMYTFKNPYWFSNYVKKPKSDSVEDIKASFINDASETVTSSMVYTVRAAAAYIAGFTNNAVMSLEQGMFNGKHITNEEASEFLFGEKMVGSEAAVHPNWIITDASDKYSLKNSLIDGDAYKVIPVKDDAKKPSDVIWEYGMRGITNPLVGVGKDVENHHDNITYWNDFNGINLNDTFDKQTLQMVLGNQYSYYTSSDNWWGDTNVEFYYVLDEKVDDWNNRVTRTNTFFRTYNLISAEAADLTFNIRQETMVFDSKTQLSFRAVDINERERYNLVCLEGRIPGNDSEIAISEEFAAKNHLKVGMTMMANNGYFVISGIATDAFSYIPSQDIDNPLPNSKKAAVIYGTREAIDNLRKEAVGKDGTDRTMILSYFLWDKHQINLSVNDKYTLDKAYISNNVSALANDQAVIKKFVDNGVVTDKATDSFMKFTGFNQSPYRYSWSIQPMVMKVYKAIVFTASGVIALLAIVAMIIGVRKTIDYNSKQIGILKALGTSPKTISISYLSYSIMIGFIAVPIAWILGICLQIPFGHMFINWFSLLPHDFIWDWISFVIAFVALGVVSGIISFASAFILNNKPILKILNSSVKWGHLSILDWMKSHTFRKANFSTRFSITIASSGSKQIIMLSIMMLVASFFVTGSLAIPAIVTKVNQLYYQAVNYSNKYNEVPMTGNAPLSKNAISYWNGQEYAEDQYVNANLQLDDTDSRYGYYKDNSTYSGTISNSSAIPQYLYDAENGQFENTYLYVINHMDSVMDNLGFIFGNNFYNSLGTSFSIGMIDQIYGIVLQSYENVYADSGITKGVNDKPATDEEKMKYAQNISRTLTTAIPKIVEMIMRNAGSSGGDTSDNGTANWKTKILGLVNDQVPSYVKGYLQRSESRQDQYAIGFQNEIYIPGEETLTTNVASEPMMINGKTQNALLTGLDKNQNSILINDKLKKSLYLTPEVKERILDVLSGINIDQDINIPEFGEIYNAKTKELTLPVLPNKQAESAYSLGTGNLIKDWTNTIQYLQFKANGKDTNLPRNAWVYDDTDYADYLTKNKDNKLGTNVLPYVQNGVDKYNHARPNKLWTYDETPDGHFYLDPSKLDNGKMTYTQEFDNNELTDKAMLFKDFTFGEDGKPNGTFLRPYYQFKNIKLFMPKSLVDPEAILWGDGLNHTIKNLKTSGWYEDNIPDSNVPSSVRDSYKTLLNGENSGGWLAINAYDRGYYQTGYETSGRSPLTNLTDAPGYWYRWILAGNKPQFSLNSSESLSDYLASLGAPNGLKINFKSIGSINSYNDKLMVIDADIANILSGYPNSRAYQYNYQVFDKSTLVPGSNDEASVNNSELKSADGETVKSRFDRYKAKDVNTKSFKLNMWNNSNDPDNSAEDNEAEYNDLWQPQYYKLKDSVVNYAPHNFYNGKLSNIDEPLNLSSAINEVMLIKVGQYAIGLGHSVQSGVGSSIQSQTLLSTAKALTNQVAALAISIGTILVIAIIIVASLLTMLTGDIYIAQYKRFMVLLRALGYNKWSIATYTFGTVTVLSLIAWVLGTIIAWSAITGGVAALWAAGFAIPVGIDWWPILLSLLLLAISYVGSLYVSSAKARKSNPSEVLTATAE